MRFKITNSDSSRYFPNRYTDWPTKLHNINSRPFKKTFNYTAYQKIQFLWVINSYVGPAPERSMTFFSYFAMEHNEFVVPEISIATVSLFLKDNPIIDDRYLPEEGDELRIFKDYFYHSIKGISRPYLEPKTISLIFKNGEWTKGKYRFDFDETKLVHSGVLEI